MARTRFDKSEIKMIEKEVGAMVFEGLDNAFDELSQRLDYVFSRDTIDVILHGVITKMEERRGEPLTKSEKIDIRTEITVAIALRVDGTFNDIANGFVPLSMLNALDRRRKG